MWQAPIQCPTQTIEPSWIDYNGHLNMAFYHVLFDRGVDHAYDLLGIGADYVRQGGGSCFTMEVHVNYRNELTLDDPVRVTWQLLDHDSKRLHFCQSMHHAGTGELAATAEQLALHVDMAERRSAPFPAGVLRDIESLMTVHATLPREDWIGRTIGIRRT